MDNAKWTFGLTMMIVGMGGTFLTLWVLGLVMDLLKKLHDEGTMIIQVTHNPEWAAYGQRTINLFDGWITQP